MQFSSSVAEPMQERIVLWDEEG